MRMHRGVNPKTKPRRGLIQLEIAVSAILLGTLICCLVGLNYRLLGVVKDTKHYQIALHEAANEVQRLTASKLDELDERIAQSKLPEDIQQALPGGTIDVQRVDDPTGTRVVVRIRWDRPGKPTEVELVGWVTTKESRP